MIIGLIKVNCLDKEPEAFNYPISKNEAERLLSSNFHLPFAIMCKDYNKTGEWEQVEKWELDAAGQLPERLTTFEIWATPRNIGTDFNGNKFLRN